LEKYSSEKLIRSLASVTDHTDRELLELSLVKSLYEILNVSSVKLFNIYHFSDHIDCFEAVNLSENDYDTAVISSYSKAVNIDDVIGLSECINNKKSVSISEPDNGTVNLFPITDVQNKVISIFKLRRPKGSDDINEELISGYFQIYKNYLTLLDESERDTLTKLLNRRTLERDLQKIILSKSVDNAQTNATEIKNNRRNSQTDSHWLAVSDIDLFKLVNDTYGHLYGDEVLLLLANIMRSVFRAEDMLFRFGGEEFVVILNSISEEGAHAVLERFREAVESYDFPQVGRVTISVGFVGIIKNSVATEILGRADKALYLAKGNGRNQVQQYEKLVESGQIKQPNRIEDDVELF